MNVEQKRQLENQLIVMGLNKLEDPELVPQLAMICNLHPGYPDGNDFLLGLINECDQAKRREMYEALKPYIKFKLWPFENFIIKLKEHAQNVESRDEPILIGGKKYEHVPQADAEFCLLELKCCKCTRTEEFTGATLVAAMTAARSVGWVRDLERQKEVCPKCPAVRPN